mmetsp:Transcript_20471/g.63268  ORF Transcript_20471/g.63268 Transcript_20471/m.63268 type:complete len:289 (-) Transcript_20471:495-1361(-)
MHVAPGVARALTALAMGTNGLEIVGPEEARRVGPFAQGLLSYAALLLCDLDTTSFAPVAALQAALLFSASSWVWALEPRWSPIVPYPLFYATLPTALASSRARTMLISQLMAPRIDGLVVGATAVLSVLTVLALCAWSAAVRGEHGPLLELLGPPFRRFPALVPLFGLGNALVEELEFRAIVLGALVFDSDGGFWSFVAVAAQALLFALQHVKGGFPNGALGGALVFSWGAALGLLRLYARSIWPGFLVHVVADTTIALLLRRREKDHPEKKRQLDDASPARPTTKIA